jgi:hypothetical protein
MPVPILICHHDNKFYYLDQICDVGNGINYQHPLHIKNTSNNRGGIIRKLDGMYCNFGVQMRICSSCEILCRNPRP